MVLLATVCLVLLLVTNGADAQTIAAASPANRLTYLDEYCSAYYVGLGAPRLTTPQWVGEPDVRCVVTIGIDDMRDPARYEAFLRPLLTRLQQIDGRAPVSIMTNQIDPADPQLSRWLAEGLSLETHTVDHPCPCLQGGDFARAKSTYDRCVDQLFAVPGNRPVAFRFPCMDSLNTPSPRAYSEIFNRTTPAGNFLQISSSVTCVFTEHDPALPRELTIDAQGRPRFAKYVPFPAFVNRVDNYPYPYVIGKLCWEFPCAVPDDWQGHNLQQAQNPQTIADQQANIDATVLKEGVVNIICHPHGWIRSDQLVEIVDHAVEKYRGQVKFLTFRECADRLSQHLLAGETLRNAQGGDNGVRLLDLNHDGFMDVVIGNERLRRTRLWQPDRQAWAEFEFPAAMDDGHQIRFGVWQPNGWASCLVVAPTGEMGAWDFTADGWKQVAGAGASVELSADSRRMLSQGVDIGLRLRDLDLDGRCELLISNPHEQAVWRWTAKLGSAEREWIRDEKTPLPADVNLVDDQGRDAGLRLVDLNADGYDDLVFANGEQFSIDLWDRTTGGWHRRVRSGRQPASTSIPAMAVQGQHYGTWFANNYLWLQNEFTDRLPDGIDRISFADLIASPASSIESKVEPRTESSPGQPEVLKAEPAKKLPPP